jgi:hypothetical protein
MNLRRNLAKEVQHLGRLMAHKAKSPFENFKEVRHNLDRHIVPVQSFWDFFFDMFSQRKSIYKSFLRRCDGIVSECYKLIFNRLRKPNPWTSTPPLCYLEKAFSPATTRRGVRLSALSPVRITNPFPVIKIPYDRIANPWTLTSLIHEVSHDIHGDIPNFWQRTRLKIYKTLRKSGIPKEEAAIWSFWHKEMFADLFGILFGGPAVVRSLMDLMSRPRYIVMRFKPHDSHPTPYFRILINTYTLGRLGFSREAEKMSREWKSRYPLSKSHKIPARLLRTASKVIPIVVRTLLWTPYAELGGRRAVDLVNYSKKTHDKVLIGTKELLAGRRVRGLAKRLIISAAVYAFERRPDKAKVIKQALFRSLNGTRALTAVSPPATRAIRAVRPDTTKRRIVVFSRWPRVIYRRPKTKIIYRRPRRRWPRLKVKKTPVIKLRRRRISADLKKRVS